MIDQRAGDVATSTIGDPSSARHDGGGSVAGGGRSGGGMVFVLAVFGALLGVAALGFKIDNAELARPLVPDADSAYTPMSVVLGGVAGYGYLIAGVLARIRQADNRTGLLLVLVGVALFAEDVQLSADPWLHSVGMLFAHASSALVVHLVLAFPAGRLMGWAERVLAAIAYAGVFVLHPIMVLFTDSRDRPLHKVNLLMVADNRTLPDVLDAVLKTTGIAVASGVLLVLIRRWVRAGPPMRRVLAPMFLAGLVGAVGTVAAAVPKIDTPLGQAFSWPPRVAACLVPVGFLIGVWRVRVGRTPVTALLSRLREPMPAGRLRAELAEALRDPSLQVGYWRSDMESFVDSDGRPIDVPALGESARAATMVESHGRRIAVLLHDPALREERHVLDAVVAAAELALENQRLTAEVRAQLAEMRALAGRLVSAGDAVRRRLERDLHDGAQQRLVTALFLLRTAVDRLTGTADPGSTALLTRAVVDLDGVVGELRDLARGIHPSILTDAGLLVALRCLVDRIPGPEIFLRAGAVPRLSSEVEATAYFVVAEAVTNALKHAHADRVQISVDYGCSALCVDITDDGCGGADINAGSGLLGLCDRVSALGGTLSVRSAMGVGTSVTTTVPVLTDAQPAPATEAPGLPA